MTQAKYFDGKTATSHIVSLSIVQFSLKFIHQGKESIWPLNQVSFEKIGSNNWAIGYQSEQLILSDKEIKILTHKNDNAQKYLKIKNPYANLFFYIIGPIVVITLIFNSLGSIADLIAQFIPPKLEKFLMQETLEHFKETSCNGKTEPPVLNEIFQKLKLNSNEYHLFLINEESPNAFAMPGKIIILTKGLVENATSPEELAAVIAHEVGHILKKHHLILLIRKYFIQILFSSLTGSGQFSSFHINDYLGNILALSFSIEQEKEADDVAISLLTENNISLEGFKNFFNTLEKINKKQGIPEFSLTHPTNKDRISKIEEILKKEYYAHRPLTLQEGWEKARQNLLNSCN